MTKILWAALLGAASILLLAGLGVTESPSAVRSAALPLPPVAADAAVSESPRECSNARNVTTGCTYP